MEKIIINDKEYELERNVNECFKEDEIKALLTDYFDERIEYKKKFKDEYVPLVVEKVDNESENNK